MCLRTRSMPFLLTLRRLLLLLMSSRGLLSDKAGPQSSRTGWHYCVRTL